MLIPMSNRKPNYLAGFRLRDFQSELFRRRSDWPLAEAAAKFNVQIRTIRNWVKAVGLQFPSENGGPGVDIIRQGERSVIRVKSAPLDVSPQLLDHAVLSMAGRLLGFGDGTALDDSMRRLQQGLLTTPDERGEFIADSDPALLRLIENRFAIFRDGARFAWSCGLSPIPTNTCRSGNGIFRAP